MPGSWGRYRIAIVPLCIVMLTPAACDSPENEPLNNPGYALSGHVTTYAPTDTHPALPQWQLLQVTLAPDNFEGLDILTLSGCALQKTLGKYQSKLGKGASDSQRLLLDLEYLHTAPACIASSRSHKQVKLATFLENARQLKREQLPARIYNATLANTEFSQFWHKPVSERPGPKQQGLTLSAIQAINLRVERWLSGDYRANNIEFEIQLSEIAKGSGLVSTGDNRELLHAIRQLEQQLLPILPSTYRVWLRTRDDFFTRLGAPTPLD